MAIMALMSMSSAMRIRLPSNSAASGSAASSGGSTAGACPTRWGRRMITFVPWPCWLSMAIVPRIRSTRFFTIARPSPVPWMPLAVEVRSREKES